MTTAESSGPRTLFRHPTGYLPVIFSLAALAVVVVHVAWFGTAREVDEGAAAHLWQLLMAGQALLVVVFAVRWLPESPKRALPVLALQVAAALAAMTPVFLLHL